MMIVQFVSIFYHRISSSCDDYDGDDDAVISWVMKGEIQLFFAQIIAAKLFFRNLDFCYLRFYACNRVNTQSSHEDFVDKTSSIFF